MLPLPSFLPARIVQLYLLHAINKFEILLLVLRQLAELFVIQYRIPSDKKGYPAKIENASDGKYCKYQRIIDHQHNAEYDETQEGKQDIYGAGCKEGLYPLMIIDPLKDIPRHFYIKKTKRQSHQLQKEIGKKADIDPAAQMRQYISPQ